MKGPLPSRVAIHESGHALCCLLMGVRVISATVEPSGEFAGLVLRRAAGRGTPVHADAMRDATVLAAGRVAEEMFFGDADGLGQDERGTRELERRIGRPVAAMARNHAERILSPRRAALLALARELDRRGTMTGDEVEAMAGRLGVPARPAGW